MANIENLLIINTLQIYSGEENKNEKKNYIPSAIGGMCNRYIQMKMITQMSIDFISSTRNLRDNSYHVLFSILSTV